MSAVCLDRRPLRVSRVTPHGQMLIFRPGEKSLRESFLRFHEENPEVYDTLVQLSDRWLSRRPGEPCGIGMLYEVARWTISLRTKGEPLKLNNNYRAFYARRLMDEHPRFEGLFRTRKQRA